MTERLAAEIAQRHVEAPWPPYRGRNRAGTQCAFCNRTWPCDAARLLRAAAQADTPTPEQFAEIDRLVAESKAEMAAQADTAPGGGLREALAGVMGVKHGPFLGTRPCQCVVHENARAALAAPNRDAGLDAAWAAAEAALPDGWRMLVGREVNRPYSYWATASEDRHDPDTHAYTIVSTSHDGRLKLTAADAIRELTAMLAARLSPADQSEAVS